MSGADGGAPAPGPPPAPAGDTPMVDCNCYVEKYNNMPDALEGRYQAFYRARSVDAGITPQVLYDRATSTNNRIPKVYMFLSDIDGTPRISTFHRPWRYPDDEVDPSPWDGATFGFLGNVDDDNAFIATRELPTEAFDDTHYQRVPTAAAMDALVGALTPTQQYVDAQAHHSADNRRVRTRFFMPIPHKYVAANLDRDAPPKVWWTELGGAIRNDSLETELADVLDFLCICLTKQVVEEDDNDADAYKPVTHIGDRDSNLPPLAEDRRLNKARMEILHGDLAGLRRERPPPRATDGTLALAETIREEGRLDRELRRAERLERVRKEESKKKPSYVFPSAYLRWMQLCMVVDEEDLEPVYLRFAEINKAERRKELQQRVNARAADEAAAGKQPPIVTKELYEMVMDGDLGSRDTEQLTKGVSPFTCGFITDVREDVEIKVNRYDISQSGNLNPTVAEQALFSTKEVPFPSSTYKAGVMLKATSIFLDVVQGESNSHAKLFREFCKEDWADIEDSLQKTRDPLLVGSVLPLICRRVQILMVGYLQAICTGKSPDLPKYRKILTLVSNREFSRFQPIPRRYTIHRAPPPAPAPATSGQQEDGSGGPTDANAAGKRQGKPLGEPDPNRNKVAKWEEAFTKSGKTMASLKGKAPITFDKSKTPFEEVEVCLTFHLKGRCWKNCERCATHRKLNREETEDMEKFIEAELPPQ